MLYELSSMQRKLKIALPTFFTLTHTYLIVRFLVFVVAEESGSEECSQASIMKRRDKKEKTKARLVTSLKLKLADEKNLSEFYSTF